MAKIFLLRNGGEGGPDGAILMRKGQFFENQSIDPDKFGEAYNKNRKP